MGTVVGVILAASSGPGLYDMLDEARPRYVPDVIVILATVVGSVIVPLVAGGQLAVIISTQLGLPQLVVGFVEPIIGGLVGRYSTDFSNASRRTPRSSERYVCQIPPIVVFLWLDTVVCYRRECSFS
ncbi:hypothetical protein ACFQE1_07055 [Halobium palmae]|uniref:Uncharacterized protein n=1 Tax=Halobium palmae TaxID=1776492 RepID=A0ABD5RXI2_9EURY